MERGGERRQGLQCRETRERPVTDEVRSVQRVEVSDAAAAALTLTRSRGKLKITQKNPFTKNSDANGNEVDSNDDFIIK
jgi:hypothetical protein